MKDLLSSENSLFPALWARITSAAAMTETVKTHKLNSVPELTAATVTAPKLTSSSSRTEEHVSHDGA